MYRQLIIFIILSSILSADELSEKAGDSLKKTKSRLPALELLPQGSILKKISIPRYNADYSPASLLTADQFEVMSDQEIKGTNVGISLYDKKGNIKTQSVLNLVSFNQTTGLLTSKENLTFSGELFIASSQGVILEWNNQRGFLLGKNQSIIYIKKQSPMTKLKQPPVKKKSSLKTKKLASAVAAAATIASSPTFLTAQELARIDEASQPSTELFITQLDQTKAALEATAKAEAEIEAIRQELTKKLGEIPKLGSSQPTPPELVPTKGKEFIRITSDRLLFDAKKGIFVYYGNIKITHPNYVFTCDGELKIILSEAATAKKLKPEEKAKLKPNDLFDDISQIIATNNIIVIGKDKKGKPVTATTEKLSFSKTTGDIILQGKGSRITTPDGQMKVVTNNGYIKLDKDFNASGQGVDTDFSIPERNKKPKP